MAKRSLFILCLLFVVYSPDGQNKVVPVGYREAFTYAEQLFSSAAPTELTDSLSIKAYKKVIDLLSTSHVNDAVLFTSLVHSGILKITYQKDSAALPDFLNSVNLHKLHKAIPDSLLFKPYLYTGSIYYRKFYYDSAFHYFKLAEGIITEHPATKESARLYNMMGALFYETGDYKKCIQYFEKALALIDSSKPEHVFFEVNYNNNIASAFRKLHQYKKALIVYKSLLGYNINQKEILHNIGVTYLEDNAPREALYYLKQVDYSNQVKYNDLAKAYLKLKAYDSAGLYIEKANKAYSLKSNRQKNIDHGITLLHQGNLLMEQQKTELAISSYHSALLQIDPDFNNNNITANPSAFAGLHNSYLLFEVLTAKAKAFLKLYNEKKTVADLRNAYQTFASALLLARQVEKMYHSDEARFFLEENAAETYKLAVQTSLQLYKLTKEKSYLNSAFVFCENSKASVLQTELHELDINLNARLPHKLLEQQTALKATALRLEVLMQQTSDSSAIEALKIQIRDNDIRLSSLQDKLQDDPRYYQYKFKSTQIDVQYIQQKVLTKDAALLSYYYYNNQLICFYITTDNFGYTATSMAINALARIAVLIKQLNAGANSDRLLISNESQTLYRALILPILKQVETKKHLIIIPYNEINFVPFDVLTPAGEDQLLLNQHAISYNYSANFLTDHTQKTNAYKVLALAPFASGNKGQEFARLDYSQQEVKDLKGKTFLNEQATKQNFITNYSDYPILHFATHAIVNDSLPLQSYIAFYKSKETADTGYKLYGNEIYQLALNKTKLVILSACETGSGKLVNQEGIISLSRAFSYAGCKSVLTSLWKADDASTAFILKAFHSYLSRGFSKDEALQKAKIDYLQSTSIEARNKTPFFWAHLVLIGNNEPVVPKSYSMYFLGLILLLFTAAVFFIIKNRMHKMHTVKKTRNLIYVKQ